MIHDGGYAYGYYVLTLEKWPSDGGTASNIRVYDAKTQRVRLLISTDKEVREVVWNEKTKDSASASFTVNTAEGIDLTFQFDPATLTAETAGGIPVDGKGAFDTAEMEALQEKASQAKDLRGGIFDIPIRTLANDEYDPAQIMTFTFNAGTIFTGHEAEAKAVMEAGKNPGLGVRALHDEGITGKGINVAIIDQNLLLDHPEFAGKITAYYDTGCDAAEDSGSIARPGSHQSLGGRKHRRRARGKGLLCRRAILDGRQCLLCRGTALDHSAECCPAGGGKRSAWYRCPPLRQVQVHLLKQIRSSGMRRWRRRRRQESLCWIVGQQQTPGLSGRLFTTRRSRRMWRR